METLKKWGMYIVAAGIFLLSIFAVLGRRKEEPKQEETPLEVPVRQIQESNKEIIELQKNAIKQTQAPPPTNAPDIDKAIEEWQKS